MQAAATSSTQREPQCSILSVHMINKHVGGIDEQQCPIRASEPLSNLHLGRTGKQLLLTSGPPALLRDCAL